MTGFFAGFREPMVLAAMATMEVFDKRNVRHWAAMSLVAASMATLGLLWIGIRVEYRKDYVAVDNFQLSRSAVSMSLEPRGWTGSTATRPASSIRPTTSSIGCGRSTIRRSP